MDPAKLQDSIKFNTVAKDFAKTWSSRKSSREEKEIRLVQLLLCLEEFEVLDSAPSQEVAQAEAKKLRAKASEPLTGSELSIEEELDKPGERARIAAEADRMLGEMIPAETVLLQYVKEEMAPKFQRGVRQYAIPRKWRGRYLSTDHMQWGRVLDQLGLSHSRMEWVKDDREWRGEEIIPGQNMPLVLA